MLLLLIACSTEPKIAPEDTFSAVDSPSGTPIHQPEGDDSTEPTTDSDPTDSAPPDTTTPPEPTVRFVALGDAGEGNDEQYQVADAIGAVCAVHGCDFALYLGDNFYDTGVSDVNDDQFQDKFELPYADLDFPFYISLGNHDYGGDGIGWELWKGEIYVDYTNYSDKWVMPDLYYTFQQEHTAFFALDSTQLFWGILDDQQSWLSGALAATSATWTIAFGHHPYLSNGSHGNAGSYEGLDWLPIVNGGYIQEFIEESVCDQVDVYLCGHDHNLQWPETTCGTEFIVSGAGAKTTDLEGDNATWFEYDEEGFVWVEIVGNTFTGVFYDANGVELYRRTITK